MDIYTKSTVKFYMQLIYFMPKLIYNNNVSIGTKLYHAVCVVYTYIHIILKYN